MSYASWKTQIETAITAVTTGLASGQATVRYSIGDMEHEVQPSPKVLKDLLDSYREVCREAARSSKGSLRLAKLNRVSGIGNR